MLKSPLPVGRANEGKPKRQKLRQAGHPKARHPEHPDMTAATPKETWLKCHECQSSDCTTYDILIPVCIYIYIYIHIYIMCLCISVYIYIYREREREMPTDFNREPSHKWLMDMSQPNDVHQRVPLTMNNHIVAPLQIDPTNFGGQGCVQQLPSGPSSEEQDFWRERESSFPFFPLLQLFPFKSAATTFPLRKRQTYKPK